jgi:hypothetical protein
MDYFLIIKFPSENYVTSGPDGLSILRRQKALVIAGEYKIRCGMPILLLVFFAGSGQRITGAGRPARPLDSHASIAVTNKSPQQPVHSTDRQDNSVLRTREVPKKYVYDTDGTENYADGEPPEDPAMNPYVDMDMHGLSLEQPAN